MYLLYLNLKYIITTTSLYLKVGKMGFAAVSIFPHFNYEFVMKNVKKGLMKAQI